MKAAAWTVLALLLAAMLAGAATHDRRRWPGVVGDEATYLMAAQSLAWDHDLRYERRDYDRFFGQWGVQPDGLILQSADGGKTLVYGKPAAYPLFLAPFLRLSPLRGPWIANALLLALATLMAARTLGRRLGPAAPLWVAAWTFASVTFAYVFWAHADLFLACLAAIALALVYGGSVERGAAAGRLPSWRLVTAGVLLGLVTLARPLYAPLLVPALFAAPRGSRRRAALALAAGVLAVGVVTCLANLVARGTWSSYGGDRRSYYAYTGFPQVDAAAADWERQLQEHGTHGWIKPETLEAGFDTSQTAWNVVYYLVGRHVGLLPYFLPLLLGLLAWRRGEGRWALPLAALFAAAVLFWVRPFNFYGGGGAIANRYFLPAYPALWFLAARPLRGARALLPPLLAAALAAPFLWPLWMAPRDFPLAKDGSYRWASVAARRWLPYETTLSHLKPAGQEDVHHNGLWVKLLTPGERAVDGGAALCVAPGGPGDLLVGSPRPLAGVVVQAAPGERLAVDGGAPSPVSGGTAWHLPFSHPRAVHRMWWTDDPFYLYQVRVEPPPSGPAVTFRITAEQQAVTAGRQPRVAVPRAPPAGQHAG